MKPFRWLVFGETVPGAAHLRLNQPCQDAIRWQDPDEERPFAIVAVADGHGGAKSFRSDRGSKFAVDAAIRGISDFLAFHADSANPSAAKRMAGEELPRELVKTWRAQVEKDLEQNPLPLPGVDALEMPAGTPARHEHVESPTLAYGSTMLAAAMTANFALWLQLGDGDIVFVSDEGEASRPIPKDPNLLGNQTTSLCTQHAWRDFRVEFQIIDQRPPALVLLSTDGYSNSYANDAGFLKIGPDILQMIRSDGLAEVRRELPGWLSETSAKGSGDDITLGLMLRLDIVEY